MTKDPGGDDAWWETPMTKDTSLSALHVPEEGTGVHRHEGGELTFACAECGMDWPCDVVQLAKAARAVLDFDEKERWSSPHDWLAGLIGYYP